MRTNVLQKASAAMMKSMISQLRAEGKNLPSILSALEDEAVKAGDLGLAEFSAETVVTEAELDAEFATVERDASDEATNTVVLAADAGPAQRKPRSARTDGNQFQLKF